jgi:hypothetical protein
MYWTKNGSIPSQTTDGTEGWQQAPSPPTEIPEGKELVWLNWEWIIRDPKPADRAGYQWNWNHSDKTWVEGAYPTTSIEVITIEPVYADSLGADSSESGDSI